MICRIVITYRNIVAKAHMRSNGANGPYYIVILSMSDRCFKNTMSPRLKQYIVLIEKVQRRFTKRLRKLDTVSYPDRLRHIGIPSVLA